MWYYYTNNCVNNKMLKHDWLLKALICDLCTSQFQKPSTHVKATVQIFFSMHETVYSNVHIL